jgi:hypothetical protein
MNRWVQVLVLVLVAGVLLAGELRAAAAEEEEGAVPGVRGRPSKLDYVSRFVLRYMRWLDWTTSDGVHYGYFATNVLVVHLGVTLCMTGMVWFVQWVHYPLFIYVGREQYPTYERKQLRALASSGVFWHTVELVTGVLMLRWRPPQLSFVLVVVNLALLVLAFLSTAFLQIPMHMILKRSYTKSVHYSLVNSNWVRTVLWTVRAVLLLHVVQRILIANMVAPAASGWDAAE